MAGRKRIPRTAWLLAAAQLLLLAAILASLYALMNLPLSESQRANRSGQRVVIDAVTGQVAVLSAPEVPAFDVAPEAPPAPDTPPTPTPAEPEAPTPTPGAAATPDTALPPLALTRKPVHITAVARGAASLAEAPADAVTERSDAGVLPKRGSDGATPATLYGRPHSWPKKPVPSVAVLLTGLGRDDALMKAALALPPEISLSFSPYGKDSREWSVYARNLGHEAWLDLPAETDGFPVADPGPLGVHRGLSRAEIVSRLRKAMQVLPGFVGFVLPPGQTALTQGDVIMPALEELRQRGLLVAVGSSAVKPETIAHLGEVRGELLFAGLASAVDAGEDDLRSLMQRAESAAGGGAAVLVVMEASPPALKVLGSWARDAQDRTALVPASAFARPAR